MWSRLWVYVRSKEGILFILAFAGVGLLTHFLFVAVLLPWITRQGAEYVLPSLVGRNFLAVSRSLEAAGFEAVVIDSQYVPDKPPYVVLLQDPPSGTRIKKGRKVYLTITSAVPPTVPFPRVEDMPYEEAHRLLTETYKFRIGSVEYDYGREPDIVMAAKYKGQVIQPGTAVPKYSTIDLVVSRGMKEQKVPFVSVVGLSLEEAVARLNAVGLSVGKIRYKPNPDVPPGHVYRQYPERVPNDSLPIGTPIDLIVNGKAPSTSVEE